MVLYSTSIPAAVTMYLLQLEVPKKYSTSVADASGRLAGIDPFYRAQTVPSDYSGQENIGPLSLSLTFVEQYKSFSRSVLSWQKPALS